MLLLARQARRLSQRSLVKENKRRKKKKRKETEKEERKRKNNKDADQADDQGRPHHG